MVQDQDEDGDEDCNGKNVKWTAHCNKKASFEAQRKAKQFK